MNVLFQEIKQSILNLVGAGIEALPGFLVAIAFLIFPSWAAKFARQVATRVTDMAIKNQSLRSLLIQLSYVATWVTGILIRFQFQLLLNWGSRIRIIFSAS